MQIVKTPLRTIASTSVTASVDDTHRILTSLGLDLNPSGLAQMMDRVRSYEQSRTRKHPKGMPAPVVEHLERCLKYYASLYMRGLGFVFNNESGDTGIVYNVSYVQNDEPKDVEKTAAELVMGGKRYSFHVQVALPNGVNTSWRVSCISRLDDESGFAKYKQYYF